MWCVCVCVCMFSLSSRTCSISLGALCKCVHHQMQELSVLFFCPLHNLHVPLFTPELLVSVNLCLEGQLQETESLSPVQ